jgi:glycosyltransferase involved in cell wall biosynthesis
MLIFQICADVGIAPGGTKGAAVHLQQIAGALQSRGHRVVTIARREAIFINPHPAPVRSLDQGIETAMFEFGIPDLVYERYALGHLGGLEFARRRGVPFMLEVNAPLTMEAIAHRNTSVGPQEHAVERRLFAESDAVIAVSTPLAGFIERFRGNRAISVVPNGVDPAAFPSPASHVESDTVAFLGHPKPWHGIHRLAAVAATLDGGTSTSRVLVIGGGSGGDELLRQAQARNVLDRVIVTGAVPRGLVAFLLAHSAVGIAPYPPTDFFYFSPLKVIEYMMAGLPVVSTELGDIAATVGDGGLIVDPADDRGLEQAVALLLGDPDLRREMGARGRRRAMTEFTWDRAVDRIEEATMALAGQRP